MIGVLLFIINISIAFVDMVIDTIVIDQAKRDPANGAQNL